VKDEPEEDERVVVLPDDIEGLFNDPMTSPPTPLINFKAFLQGLKPGPQKAAKDIENFKQPRDPESTFPREGVQDVAFHHDVQMEGQRKQPLFYSALDESNEPESGKEQKPEVNSFNEKPTEVLLLTISAMRDMQRPEQDMVRLAKREIPEKNPKWQPTIREHCVHWNCNKLQYYSLVLYCVAILQVVQRQLMDSLSKSDRISKETMKATSLVDTFIQDLNDEIYKDRKDIDVNHPDFVPLHQLKTIRALLCGPAGKGKSYVLHAALDFARAWGVAASFVSTATTGAAALLVHAVTYYHALGANLKFEMGSGKALTAKRDQWSEAGIFVIDEAGKMAGQNIFHTNRCLKALKQQEFFGGLNFFAVQDNFQPATVGQTNFTPIRPKDVASDPDPKMMEGLLLWRHGFNASIELTEDNRCVDPVFSKAQSRLATNQLLQEDPPYYNQSFQPSEKKLNIPEGGAVCTHDNVTAMACNFTIARMVAASKPVHPQQPGSWRDRGLLIIYGELSGRDQEFPPGVLRHLRGLPAKKTEMHSTMLPFIINNVYRVRDNLAVDRGIANGTIAEGRNVIFCENVDEDEVVKFQIVPGPEFGGGFHYTYARYTDGLILRHTMAYWRKQQFVRPGEGSGIVSGEGVNGYEELAMHNLTTPELVERCHPALDLGEFPLSRKSVSFNFKRSKKSEPEKAKLDSFPLDMANVVTGDSLQGTTQIFLLVLEMGPGKNNSTGYVYMLVTRVRERTHIFFRQKFQLDPEQYPLRVNVMQEQDRIRELCNRTYKVLCRWCEKKGTVPESINVFATEQQYRDWGSTTVGTNQFANSKVYDIPLNGLQVDYLKDRNGGCVVRPSNKTFPKVRIGDYVRFVVAKKRGNKQSLNNAPAEFATVLALPTEFSSFTAAFTAHDTDKFVPRCERDPAKAIQYLVETNPELRYRAKTSCPCPCPCSCPYLPCPCPGSALPPIPPALCPLPPAAPCPLSPCPSVSPTLCPLPPAPAPSPQTPAHTSERSSEQASERTTERPSDRERQR
jgi:hypothetical protein